MKKNVTILYNHISYSAKVHNIKQVFLHIFWCKQDGIFNVFKTVILIPILITNVRYFSHGHFGHGHFGQDISAMDILAMQNAKGRGFGHNPKFKYFVCILVD